MTGLDASRPTFLARFRWYRRKRGGVWYYVNVLPSVFGSLCWWTQALPPEPHELLRTEDHTDGD